MSRRIVGPHYHARPEKWKSQENAAFARSRQPTAGARGRNRHHDRELGLVAVRRRAPRVVRPALWRRTLEITTAPWYRVVNVYGGSIFLAVAGISMVVTASFKLF